MPEATLAAGLRALARPWRRQRHDSLLAAADWEELGQALARRRVGPGPAAPARQRNPGEGPSPLRGRGLDYAQSRAYQSGDDLRAMHWSLLARTGRPYVRVYEEEHAAPWHVLVDAHASMLFGTRVRTKATQAARAAVLAAGLQAALSPQSRLGCSLWSPQGLRARDFGTGFAAVRRIAQWLMQQRIEPPPAPAAPAVESLRDLRAWARRLALHRPVPTRLLVCSDLAWLDAAARSALWPLAARAELHALRIVDAVELALPELPAAHFLDAASGRAGWLEGGAGMRQEFARAAERRRRQQAVELRALRAAVAQAGAADTASELGAALAGLPR